MPTDRLSFLIFGHFLLPFVGDFPTRVGTDSRAFLCRFPTRRGPVEWCERSDNYVSDVHRILGRLREDPNSHGDLLARTTTQGSNATCVN